MAKNPFKDLKLANKAQAKILRHDTKADFRWAQGGLDSVTANLLTSQTGLGRTLSAKNARTVAGMQRVSRRAAASIGGTIDHGQSRVSNAYGNVIGGDPNLFRTAKATAKGSRVANAAAVAGGKLQAKAGNEALDILKQAGVTAGSAAQYELASALRARNTADATVIAQAQADLASQRAQARANERIAMIQQGMDPNGGSTAYSSAAAALNAGLLDGSISQADAEQWARRFALQYNLGPDEKQRLLQLATTGSGGGAAADNSTPYGQAFAEANGLSPSAYLPNDTEQSINLAVQSAYDPKKSVPNQAEALAILGWSTNAEGKWVTEGGTEIPEETLAAGIAYVQSTWYRIKNKLQGTSQAKAAPQNNPAAGSAPAVRDPAYLPNPSGQALSDESMRTGLPAADGRLRADAPDGTTVDIDGYRFTKTRNGWFPTGR